MLPFNQSIRIKSASRNHTTSDAGAFLLRSVIDRTGILDFLTERLHDPRDPERTQYPLSEYTVAASVDAGLEFLVDGCGQPGCGLWCVHLHQSGRSLDETPWSEKIPPAPTQCAEELRQTNLPGIEAVLDESTGGALETDAQDLDRQETHIHIRLFRLCVLKVGATMARHGRYVTFYVAQSAVQTWKRLFGTCSVVAMAYSTGILKLSLSATRGISACFGPDSEAKTLPKGDSWNGCRVKHTSL